MKKDAYYFPHYCNARHDRKLRRVIKDLGAEGYGIYFMLLEVLREQLDFRYPLADIDLLEAEFGATKVKIETIIRHYDLFQLDENDNFFSIKFIFYLQPYLEKSERAREAANIRWNNALNANGLKQLPQSKFANANANADANAIQMQCSGNADAMQVKETKVKETKVKKTKSNDISREEIASDEKFNLFWSKYKNKNKKAESYKIWRNMSEEGKDTAITHIDYYSSKSNDIPSDKKYFGYQQHPTTYLNQKTYLDEIPENYKGQKNGNEQPKPDFSFFAQGYKRPYED